MAATVSVEARAADGDYEAMVLSCIDPRIQEPVRKYLADRGLAGKYSLFTIEGAAIGVVEPAFMGWHRTFWDNLDTSVRLHKIKRVIAINHRGCTAVKLAFRESAVATPAEETKTHQTVLERFRAQVKEHQRDLKVETALMGLDGSVQVFT